MSAIKCCRKCRFSLRVGGEMVCRRYPPVLRNYELRVHHNNSGTIGEQVAVEHNSSWEQPVVSADDEMWCGEFKAVSP